MRRLSRYTYKLVSLSSQMLCLYLWWGVCISPSSAQILPTPKTVIEGKGVFAFKPSMRICYLKDESLITGKPNAKYSLVPDDQPEHLYTAEVINSAFKDYAGVAVALDNVPQKAQIFLVRISPERAASYALSPERHAEGYRLEVKTDRITIEAVTAQGLFYGAMTLRQMLMTQQNQQLNTQIIIDYPDMALRGISDDVSRGQMSNLDNFKKIIRQIATLKQNTYLLYIEDVLQMDSQSTLSPQRDTLKKTVLRELVDYARLHYVEVIPIFETLGHQENMLSKRDFQDLAEFPGAMSLCVSCEGTYQFLERAIKEIVGIFPSKYLHIGGDESFDVGLGKSQAMAQKLGGIPALHLAHYKRVIEMVKRQGKIPLMYGDMLLKYPNLIAQLPPEVQIVDWQYSTRREYPSVETFAKTKRSFYVSPTVFNFRGLFPTYTQAFPNITYLTQQGKQHQARGTIVSNWGDMGNESFKELLYLGYAWAAQCAWHTDTTAQINWDKFLGDFGKFFFRTNHPSLYKVYKRLCLPTLQVTWADFWRHPLLELRKAQSWQTNLDVNARIWLTEGEVAALRTDIDTLAKYVQRNKDHVDVLRLVAQFHATYLSKMRLQTLIQQLPAAATDAQKEQVRTKVEAHLAQIDSLRQQYSSLWNRYYLPAGLKQIQQHFLRVKQYWGSVIDDIDDDRRESPLIKSQWIYAGKNNDDVPSTAVFQMEMELKEIPETAVLHWLADTYGEVDINGREVDKVFARNIFSLTLEQEVVHMIDIADYLKIGQNVFTFRVRNYNQGLKPYNPAIDLGAGLNAIVYLRTSGNSEMLRYSDATWKAKVWNEKTPTLPWASAQVRPHRWEIIAPHFRQERKAWIEK